MKTIGPCGATCEVWFEILCGLEEKIGPVCTHLLHNVHATENF